jgi:DNA-binding SARP family transcriptional activator/energy-coupling factor transporter ATP-binding protein EcfA2
LCSRTLAWENGGRTTIGSGVDGVSIGLTGSFDVRGGSGGVGSHKARRLLARLAAVAPPVVEIDDIVVDLWPRQPPQRPAENVATLVSRLRAALGAAVVLGGRAGYRLGDPPAVVVDVRQAAALAAEAGRRPDPSEAALAAAAARRGLDLLGNGSVLVGEAAASWIDDLRSEVATVLRDLRHHLAEAALTLGDPPSAISAAGAAAATDPLDDHAHRLLMAAHHAAGEPDRALAAYERLRSALAAELGADPAPATRALHAAVLRGEPEARPAPVTKPPRRAVPTGRDAEMAVLTAAWTAAADREPSLVLITGEAGIGKTTLARALASIAEDTGGLVASARCHPAERSMLLQPVLDALVPVMTALAPAETRRLAGAGAGVLAGLLPAAANLLGPEDGSRGSAEWERRRVYDALAEFVHALSGSRPVLLMLDDLQNAGTATLELLHYLAARPGHDRLLLLATVRSEEGSEAIHTLSGVADRIEVGPLAPDVVALLAARAGAPQLAEDVLRRTRGHTLFVVETLRGIAAGETGVPDSLQAAVLARMRRTDAEVERVLRAAAVLGATVAPDDVADVLGVTVADVLHRCGQAAESRLLAEAGDRYAFANDLIQEVLYATTPLPLRTAYHRRAADRHRGRPEVEAHHAAALGDLPRAARAWLAAGTEAADRYATSDARALLDRAVDAAGRVDDPALTGRIRLQRARVSEMLGDYTGAASDLEAALAAARAAGDPHLEVTVLRQYAGDVTSAIGLPERERHLDRALRMAVELGDSAAEADLYGWQAVVAANRLRFTDAVALGARAVEAGRAAGDDGALAAGLDGLKTAHAYLGDTAALRPVLHELEPLLRRGGDLAKLRWAVFEAALPAVAVCAWEEAAGRMAEALAIDRRCGQTPHEPWFVAHLGWLERLRGRHGEAVELGRRSVDLATAATHRWWRSTTAALLATTLLERAAPGDVDEAIRLLTAADRGDTEAYVLRCLAPLAEATGERAVLVEADARLAAVRTPAGGAWLAGGDVYLAVARAWLSAGEPERARSALAPLLIAAARHGWVLWQAAGGLVDGQALAVLGDAAADRTMARAAALAREHGMAHLPSRDHTSAASMPAARAAPPGSTGR